MYVYVCVCIWMCAYVCVCGHPEVPSLAQSVTVVYNLSSHVHLHVAGQRFEGGSQRVRGQRPASAPTQRGNSLLAQTVDPPKDIWDHVSSLVIFFIFFF